MEQVIQLKFAGLKTASNQIQNGSFQKVADNVNIDREDIVTSRRGIKVYSPQITASGVSKYAFEFDDEIFSYTNGYLYWLDTTAWNQFSTAFTETDTSIGMRHQIMNGNCYFTAASGVYKLENTVKEPYLAGAPRGINGYGILTGITGFLSDDSQVAYRIVWGRTDSNNNLILGAPSERIIVQNIGTGASGAGNADVDLTIYIPNDVVDNTYFFQVYRSLNSLSDVTEPSDELFLCYEAFPTAGEIAAGSVTFTDSTIEQLLGASLYTNETQEGILLANFKPPLAKDICQFKNVMFYANTRTNHSKIITLLSVGAPNGLQVDDVITINGVAYTGKATEDSANGEFKVTTGLTVAENIAETAKSLVKTINLYTSNTELTAYYASTYNDLPGKIELVRDSNANTAFAITCSLHGDAFNPQLPNSGTSVSSESETKPNRIYFSKPSQPESVPIGYYFDCGAEDSEILRIAALRDSLFVFKSNGETYRVNGEHPLYTITPYDNTTKVIAPKTLVPFNNMIFCLSNQGIVGVSDSGTDIRSWNIEDITRTFQSSVLFPTIAQDSYAFSYESDRKYILRVNDTWYVYNSLNDAWTTWTMNDMTFAFVRRSDDRIYSLNTSNYLYQERKDYTESDFADEEYAITISSLPTSTSAVITPTTNVATGMSIKQGTEIAVIDTWDSGTGTATFAIATAFQPGAATLYTPITCRLEWLPIYGNSPASLKRFKEAIMFFENMNKSFHVEIYNNFNPTSYISNITAVGTGAPFGTGVFGQGLFGGSLQGNQEVRMFFNPSYMRCLMLNFAIYTDIAFTDFTLYGIGLSYTVADTRFSSGGQS
jgi:hypothetical protein